MDPKLLILFLFTIALVPVNAGLRSRSNVSIEDKNDEEHYNRIKGATTSRNTNFSLMMSNRIIDKIPLNVIEVRNNTQLKISNALHYRMRHLHNPIKSFHKNFKNKWETDLRQGIKRQNNTQSFELYMPPVILVEAVIPKVSYTPISAVYNDKREVIKRLQADQGKYSPKVSFIKLVHVIVEKVWNPLPTELLEKRCTCSHCSKNCPHHNTLLPNEKN